MKKTIILILSFLLLQSHFISAQHNDSTVNSGKLGLTYSSFGENYVIRFQELEGAASYNSENFYTIGLTYVHPLNSWLEAEIGLEYSRHTISIEPNLPPNIDYLVRKESFSLINIPLTLRVNFLKYFFVNGGLFLDVDGSLNSPIDNQTGIGALAGLSIKYDFKFGITAFVNPYTKMHSIVPFQFNNHPQRILESGVRIGLTYDLDKWK